MYSYFTVTLQGTVYRCNCTRVTLHAVMLYSKCTARRIYYTLATSRQLRKPLFSIILGLKPKEKSNPTENTDKVSKNAPKNAAAAPQVVQKSPPGSPKAPKMESKIDENLMNIGSGAGLGHSSSDFGVQGLPRAPILGLKLMQKSVKLSFENE